MADFSRLPERIQKDTIIAPTGCWIWVGADRNRYGCVWINGKQFAVHRAVWAIFHGEIPDGLVLCHRCDVTYCCNPEHLFTGTQKENMQDASRKGRVVMPRMYGEDSFTAKLTSKQVDEIRQSGEPYKIIAEKYGVTVIHVGAIRRGVFWKHTFTGFTPRRMSHARKVAAQ